MIFKYQSTHTGSDISSDEEKKQTINFWTGYILLIAVGTLLYITLMHILPEVYGNEHTHMHGHEHADDEKNHGHPVKGKDEKSNRGV